MDCCFKSKKAKSWEENWWITNDPRCFCFCEHDGSEEVEPSSVFKQAYPEQLPVSASRHSWKYHFLKHAHKPQNLFKTQAWVNASPLPLLLLPQVLICHNQQDWGHPRHETGPTSSAGHLNRISTEANLILHDAAETRLSTKLEKERRQTSCRQHFLVISNVYRGSDKRRGDAKLFNCTQISPPICDKQNTFISPRLSKKIKQSENSRYLTSMLSSEVERLSLALRMPDGERSEDSIPDVPKHSESWLSALSGLSGWERRP